IPENGETMGLFQKKEEKEAAQLPPPRHIAIIMDGNGRWAKKRGLPRTAGHAAGAESFRRIANYCRTLGVRYLTVYAFSTENWKRSQEEIGGIMSLLRRYLEEALREDRKSTRLNSSHVSISYAVFCLKKKKIKQIRPADLICQESLGGTGGRAHLY